MDTEKHIEYEKLTQEIYQALHDEEGMNIIKVDHNVKIEGKSTCKHQIDVYWEFEMVGEIHRVAIECKNYSKVISIGKIRDYFGVLYDVGNIKGIMVTKMGYQKGAIDFANYYGIGLKEMRFPTDKDWEGRIKDIIVDITAFTLNVKERELVPDIEWLIEKKNAQKGDRFEGSISGYTNEIKIYDDSGKIITDFYEMESRLPQNWKEVRNLEYEYPFENGFIETKEHGKIKIKSIKFTYDVLSRTSQSRTEGEEIVKAILKDVKTGDLKFFWKNR